MIVLIKGIKYKVILFTEALYEKKFGKDCDAAFCGDKRELRFKDSDTSKATIMHETIHAFYDSLLLNSVTDLKIDDQEEIFCELISEHYSDIGRITNEIHKFLKESK